MLRTLAYAGAALIALTLGGPEPAGAQQRGGAATVATIGEPNTLDPMISAGDLLGMITQHFYETLFTFGESWELRPLLAENLPEVSADGKVYTIPLRQGVIFHNGQPMAAKDVIASLKRWTELASRGRLVAGNIEAIDAVDDHTVRLTLKEPYAP